MDEIESLSCYTVNMYFPDIHLIILPYKVPIQPTDYKISDSKTPARTKPKAYHVTQYLYSLKSFSSFILPT